LGTQCPYHMGQIHKISEKTQEFQSPRTYWSAARTFKAMSLATHAMYTITVMTFSLGQLIMNNDITANVYQCQRVETSQIQTNGEELC
jgi:hypothetical protein